MEALAPKAKEALFPVGGLAMGVVFGRIAEEMPRHTIVQRNATYQIRRYEPSIAVMCDYSKGWGTSSDGTPFGSLARYIGVFGNPENMQPSKGKAEPIAMTAPVLIDSGADTHTMMFLLPASKYSSIEAAPTPSNPNVRLQTLPARLQAVRTFTGNLRPERAREQLALLLADIRRDGWVTKAPPGKTDGVEWQAAGYNAPFVIPFLKTNEVLVNVEEK